MILKKLLFILIIGTGAGILSGVGPVFTPISFSSNENAGVDEIKAQFYVDADPKTAWDVLTDYEHIPQFVSSMKESHIVERKDGDIYLSQEAEAGFLFITKKVHVLLKVHEVLGQSISFQDVSQKDFWFYKGSWKIQSGPQGGVSIIYYLQAQKNFDAPFAGDYLHGGVRDLLTAVQKKIYLQQTQVSKENAEAVTAVQNAVNPVTTPNVSRPMVN